MPAAAENSIFLDKNSRFRFIMKPNYVIMFFRERSNYLLSITGEGYYVCHDQDMRARLDG